MATADETVTAMLKRARRRNQSAPISVAFLQQRRGQERLPGPLARLVSGRDMRALDLLLLTHAMATAPPFDVTVPSAVWARALGLDGSSSARASISKAFRRLETHRLVARSRNGRRLEVTLLTPDGSGAAYSHPGNCGDRYLQLPFPYWTEGWYRNLSLPAKAFLLVALGSADGFALPAARGPEWYGISADTIERGAGELRALGLLTTTRQAKAAPLTAAGYTVENRYTLLPPFGPRGVSTKGAAARAAS